MTELLGAKELLAEKLKTLEPEITAEDRKEAETTLKVSAPTIHKYLNGDVPKPEFGLLLFEFFKGRISDRMERIRAALGQS